MGDGVATNIYAPLSAPNQGAMNPLQVLQLIGQLNQNRLFQQTYDARQAIGNAYRANTGDNGEINTPGLRTDVGRNGGFLAGEGLQQATANSSADADLKSKYQQILRSTFGQLATKPVVTDQDIATAKADAARQGVPGSFIQDYIATMPRGKAIKDWAVSQANLASGPQMATTLEPGAINEKTGVRPLVPAGAAVRQAASGQGLVPSLPLGEEQSRMASQGTAIALRERNAHYAEDMVPINGFLDSIESMGPKDTGPGKEELNKLKSALYAFSDWVPGLDKALGDPEVMANFTKGQKYATQLASQVANNIGPHTNQGLTTAFSATPNMSMTQLAAKDLGKVLYGLRNMQQVMMVQAQKEGVPDTNLLKWASGDWSTRVNPAGFMWDRLDDTERDRVIHKIETIKDPYRRAAEMTKLRNSVDMATKSGVIAGPPQEKQ